MNGWHAGGMRRVHDFGVSCLIRGLSGALADSHIPKFRTEMQPLVGLGMRRIEFSGHTGLQDRLGAGVKLKMEDATGAVESAFHAVQRWLSKCGTERTLFLMATDPGVMGALTALEESGSKLEAAVFGFGGNHETRLALRAPGSRLAGCVGFRPEAYGEGLVRAAVRILEKKPTPPAIFVEHWVFSAENVDLLYPNDRP